MALAGSEAEGGGGGSVASVVETWAVAREVTRFAFAARLPEASCPHRYFSAGHLATAQVDPGIRHDRGRNMNEQTHSGVHLATVCADQRRTRATRVTVSRHVVK